jgi:CheY-like chemotaxis protein
VTAESSLEELMFAVYLTQQQIIELLQTHLGRGRVTPEPPRRERKDVVEGAEFMAFPPAPARARKRKSVLLVDDDETTLRGAVAALEKADVPVRTATNGNEALAALSQEPPDVIALEAELSGDPGGADLVKRVKATMEWITIPIVLYTRARVQSQEEARAAYGADAFVLKGPRGPAALVSQVITVFRSVQ